MALTTSLARSQGADWVECTLNKVIRVHRLCPRSSRPSRRRAHLVQLARLDKEMKSSLDSLAARRISCAGSGGPQGRVLRRAHLRQAAASPRRSQTPRHLTPLFSRSSTSTRATNRLLRPPLKLPAQCGLRSSRRQDDCAPGRTVPTACSRPPPRLVEPFDRPLLHFGALEGSQIETSLSYKSARGSNLELVASCCWALASCLRRRSQRFLTGVSLAPALLQQLSSRFTSAQHATTPSLAFANSRFFSLRASQSKIKKFQGNTRPRCNSR